MCAYLQDKSYCTLAKLGHLNTLTPIANPENKKVAYCENEMQHLTECLLFEKKNDYPALLNYTFFLFYILIGKFDVLTTARFSFVSQPIRQVANFRICKC